MECSGRTLEIKYQNFEIKSKLKADLVFLTVSALEIYIFIFLIYNSLFHQISYRNDFVLLLIFCILFVSFLAQKGLLSKLLDNNVSEYLGQYAYSIYIMQGIGLAIANYFIWNNQAFVLSHPYLNIATTILICILIGIPPPENPDTSAFYTNTPIVSVFSKQKTFICLTH